MKCTKKKNIKLFQSPTKIERKIISSRGNNVFFLETQIDIFIIPNTLSTHRAKGILNKYCITSFISIQHCLFQISTKQKINKKQEANSGVENYIYK